MDRYSRVIRYNKPPILMLAAMAVLLGTALISHSVRAAGTQAGTLISNSAEVNFSVDGVSQPTQNSNIVEFLVDRRLDILVTEVQGQSVAAAAGAQNVALAFDVVNQSNSQLDIAVMAVHSEDPFGNSDNLDVINIRYFMESGANPGFQLTEDQALPVSSSGLFYLDQMAMDEMRRVLVVVDIPLAANGSISALSFVAQVAEVSSSGTLGALILNDDNGHVSPGGTASQSADDPSRIDSVFGDGQASQSSEDLQVDFSTGIAQGADIASNGQHADSGSFRVLAADLSLQKTSLVISDPINGISPQAKAIPGAVVEYQLLVVNSTSASTADNVEFFDNIDSIINDGTVVFIEDSYNSGACAQPPCGLQLTAPSVNGGQPISLSNAPDTDQGEINSNIVRVLAGSLQAGEQAVVRFRVEIQ